MQIIGLGTDIVETERISGVLAGFGSHFKERICTASELAAAEKKNDQNSYFAGRWAAKEAAAKALGCGIGSKCAFTDIEISNDHSGRPVMTFSGAAAAEAATLGVSDIKVSISHERHYAAATVILCGKNPH